MGITTFPVFTLWKTEGRIFGILYLIKRGGNVKFYIMK
jgi:hypothetical protein